MPGAVSVRRLRDDLVEQDYKLAMVREDYTSQRCNACYGKLDDVFDDRGECVQ